MRRLDRLLRLAVLVAAVSIGSGAVSPGTEATPLAGEPARDLAGLLEATPDGGTLRLEPGTYRGRVVIDRPVTIEADGDAVIEGDGVDSVLLVTAPDVTMRGLVIRNSGVDLPGEDSAVKVRAPRFTIEGCRLEETLFGVHLNGAEGSVVRDNVVVPKDVEFTWRGDGVHLYQSSRTVVERNTMTDGRDVVSFFSDDVVLRDNVMERGRYGLHLMYSSGTLVEGNRLHDNATGLYVMYSKRVTVRGNALAGADGPSGYGLALKESDLDEMTGNRIVGNRIGLFLDGSPFTGGHENRYENNIFAYNDVGVEFQPSVRTNLFVRNAFIDNREQLSTTTAGSLEGNSVTVDGVGNYWSDYAGYDADSDGVGDVAYRAEGLFDELTDQHPQFTFFADTPAAVAVDAAARAFPSLRPEPKAVDTAPLVDPPTLPPLADSPVDRSRSLLLASSLVLLGVAVILPVRARRRPSQVVSTADPIAGVAPA